MGSAALRRRLDLGIHRPDLLLCSGCAVTLGLVSSAYWPVERGLLPLIQAGYGSLALLCLVAGITAWSGPTGRHRARLLRGLVGLLLALTIPWMHLTGYLASFIVLPRAGFCALAGPEIVGLAAALALARRRGRWQGLPLGLLGASLLGGCLLYPVVGYTVWRPPSRSVCAAAVQPGVVDRLSPAEWAEQGSAPYHLLIVPEEGILVASFKTAGNLVLDFLGDPASNRLAAFLLSDAAVPGRPAAVLPMPGSQMPQYLGWLQEGDAIVVSRQGPGAHTLAVVSPAGLPWPEQARVIEVDYPPHAVLTGRPGDPVVILGQHAGIHVLDPRTLEERGLWDLRTPVDTGLLTLYGWRGGAGNRIYLTALLSRLVEVDFDSLRLRRSSVRLGGGHLLGVPATGEIVATDLVFDSVHVLDLAGLTVLRERSLPFTPRPVQVDPERDLLMIGDWLGGVVHFYRLSTLEPLHVSVPVGPDLRELAWHAPGDALFAASGCGVYRIRLGRLPRLARQDGPTPEDAGRVRRR